MFFVYVDESGTPGYSKNNIQNKYFVMAGIMIHSSNLLTVEQRMIDNKINHKLSMDEEVKWNSKYSKLGLSLEEFLSYRKNLYKIIQDFSTTIIATVMNKPNAYNKEYINNHFDVYKNSLFYLMERVHYFISDDIKRPETTVFVLDSRKNDKDRQLDKMLARAYREALGLGTYYTNFSYFSRTPFFSDSEDCVEIQLADHCAGPIYRLFTEHNRDWFSLIEPKLRMRNGTYIGSGLKIFP